MCSQSFLLFERHEIELRSCHDVEILLHVRFCHILSSPRFPFHSYIVRVKMHAAVWIAVVFVLCSVIECVSISTPSVGSNNQKLVVLMIDGLRWDYLDESSLRRKTSFKQKVKDEIKQKLKFFPNLMKHGDDKKAPDDSNLKLKGFPKMTKLGVRSAYLNPVYPTLSYPNMMSFSTGLYPENHGFVDNMLFDNSTNTFFEMLPAENSTDPMWWEAAEPIWITAEKNGLSTALYWWLGCEVRIHKHHPYICESHRYRPPTDELKQDLKNRVDDVVEMFNPSRNQPTNRLDMAMLYYSGVDWAGHYTGLDSPEFKKSILDIDEILNYLLKAIKDAKLQNQVNVIVVSDHGMADVKNTTFINLDKYDQYIKYQVNSGPIVSLIPVNGKEEMLYNALKADNITGLHVYKKDNIPEVYHVKGAERIGPILLECDEAYFIKALRNTSKIIGDIEFSDYFGEHGYAPSEHMRGVFLATGPAFKSGLLTEPIDIIDVYNVMCHVLKLTPLPNNGSWPHVEPLLRTVVDGPYRPDHPKSAPRMPEKSSSLPQYQGCISIIFVAIFTAIFCQVNKAM